MRMLAMGLALAFWGGALEGQQRLAERIGAVADGTVRFSYSVRPDVCGDGEHLIRFGEHESWVGRGEGWTGGRRWTRRCLDGPARVTLTIRGREVARVRVAVGGPVPPPPEGVADLGAVGAEEASRTLLGLARRTSGGGADDLVFPAVLADSVTVWPDLLGLARDDGAASRARKAAIFWLSQVAGDAASRGLDDLASDQVLDRDLREHAVFALSQLPRDEGVPILIRVARSNPDPAVRRKALFWLGQSEDPRALAVFEEILSRPQ